ncbi:putative calcium-binding protein CML31 [Panicum miliaceum]|uniref:Calcium-binding protein CML31 n=1 Tax=Panicum miliaceum TaxID=4540 RepID=A0A3L6S6I6_PANMI|nr:putative calcium-binding protein CML31 [Panicum miliaceum]
MVVASSPGELGSLFAAFDKDADGRISAAELRLCMRAALGEDVTAEDAEALVASVDADGDGLLDEGEFARLLRAEAADVKEEEEQRRRGLEAAFGMYAVEGEGRITPASLRRMLSRLGARREVDDCRAMIRRFDLDGDGVLRFDEFEIMMMNA